jgi:glyoxylase-like metal-dependent hydrolase (beta-lactamase superfamily II)
VKAPHSLFDTLFAFPPNRDTLGGTAYLVKTPSGNGLIDCPAWNDDVRQFLDDHGGVQWSFLTHRTGKGAIRQIQKTFDCPILVQEQEAYLIPDTTQITFRDEYHLSHGIITFWTPGHSPGSACLYLPSYGGVLFTGRHLLPDANGQLRPLRSSKTFHWPRQIRHTHAIVERFSPETLHYLCPGANTGFLRGAHIISNAYEQLSALNLEKMRQDVPVL